MRIYVRVIKYDAYRIKYKRIKISRGQGAMELLELRLQSISIFVHNLKIYHAHYRKYYIRIYHSFINFKIT